MTCPNACCERGLLLFLVTMQQQVVLPYAVVTHVNKELKTGTGAFFFKLLQESSSNKSRLKVHVSGN